MNKDPVIMINLGGKHFDIEQDFIDKYPESVFAKSLEVINKNDKERIEIDKNGENFSKILDFSHNKGSINFSQLSHIKIQRLLEDAKYFGIDDLIERCEAELKVYFQTSIVIAPNEESLAHKLIGENRLVIVVDSEIIFKNFDEFEYALEFVKRDRCLIMGCIGPLKACSHWKTSDEHKIGLNLYLHEKQDEDHQDGGEDCEPTIENHWTAYLLNPLSNHIILAANAKDKPSFFQLVSYACVLNPQILTPTDIKPDDPYYSSTPAVKIIRLDHPN